MDLQSLLPDILGRLEESNPPIFWSLVDEIYPAMVDGLFEASLISGYVQLNSQTVTITKNTTYFSLQPSSSFSDGKEYGEGGYGSFVIVPPGIVAPRKSSLDKLDAMNPNWQSEPPGLRIRTWVPLGVSGFAIYPQIQEDQQVVMDFLACPVNTPRPYSGLEQIPLQAEFTDLLSKYAAAILRCKEQGVEAEEAETVYQQYLSEVKDLSLFQKRIDALVYTPALGAQSRVNERNLVG